MSQEEGKSPGAFRTIREVSEAVGVPPHILRFWETRFTQLKPLQRGGNRRYYRPADVALAHALHQLLHRDGYTVKGVQKLIAAEGVGSLIQRAGGQAEQPAAPETETPAAAAAETGAVPVATLRRLRDRLAEALAA